MTEETWDWRDVSDAAVREILRLAEARLADLHDASIAADQRAGAQAAILVAIGSALLATSAVLGTVSQPPWPAVWSTLVAGVGMIAMALVTVSAAGSVDFYPGGYEPKRLIKAAGDEHWMLRFVAEDMQRRIDHNNAWLGRVAERISVAYCGALITIVLAVAVFFGVLLSIGSP